MNQPLIIQTGLDREPYVENIWVIFLVIFLWAVSIALHVPGMP